MHHSPVNRWKSSRVIIKDKAAYTPSAAKKYTSVMDNPTGHACFNG
jgi:hypothetical protein